MPARQRMRPCACGRRPVSCPTCYGSGTLFNGNKCIICNGSGTVICPDCGGTGKLWDWEEIPEENSSYYGGTGKLWDWEEIPEEKSSYSTSSYGGSNYSSSGAGRTSAYATILNHFAELEKQNDEALEHFKETAKTRKERKIVKEWEELSKKNKRRTQEMYNNLYKKDRKPYQSGAKPKKKESRFKTIIIVIIVLWLLLRFFS